MGGITKRMCGELGNVVWAALPSGRAYYLWLLIDSGCLSLFVTFGVRVLRYCPLLMEFMYGQSMTL